MGEKSKVKSLQLRLLWLCYTVLTGSKFEHFVRTLQKQLDFLLGEGNINKNIVTAQIISFLSIKLQQQ